MTFRRGLLLAAALCGAALLSPVGAAAQEEPTPFWMPVEPEKPAPRPKAKPATPSVKKKPAADGGGSQVYIAGDADDDLPRSKKKHGKGTVKAQPVKPAKKKAKASREPDYDDPPPEPKPRKKAFEPLPAFPHLEPEAAPRPSRDPAPSAPEPVRTGPPAAPPPLEAAPAVAPGEEPGRRPVLHPKKEAFDVEEDEPAPAPKPSSPAPKPAPSRQDAPPPAAPPPEASADEPEEPMPVALRWRRSLWALAVAGGWQKSHADGRGFELAYGLQLGWAPQPWLLLDLTFTRGGQQQGNGFASARVDHTLAMVRGFAAWNRGLVSLFAGGGAGGALAQTVYTLQDVGQPASTLPATAFKLAVQAGAGARMRPWRGLEVRAEVSTLLRDGRLEPLVTFAAGWAF